MSIIIETILGCDSCKRTYALPFPYGGDTRRLPAKEQRASATKEGWVTRRAKDYCKACAEKLGIRRRATYSR